jgi:hypothetical protein
VQLPDHRDIAQQFQVHIPFLKYRVDVRLFYPVVLCYPGVAAAISTPAFTEWQMDIEADPVSFITLLKRTFNRSYPGLLVKKLNIPVRHGGVTGISWNRYIVFSGELIIRSFG